MSIKLTEEKYVYKNLPICGGGYVTGISFHPAASDRLYIRTDIGGVYRYSYEEKVWKTLSAYVTAIDNAETFPLAIAVDKYVRDRLFVVCGNSEQNYLCISVDCGNSFVRRKLPCTVHGNFPGRGTGERLHYRNGRIYFGSMSEGLLISDDMGESWEIRSVNGEKNISALWISEDENVLIAGCSGEYNSTSGNIRGATLYCSNDRGESFYPLEQPTPNDFSNVTYQGYVPQRFAYDGKYLYVTFYHSDVVLWGGWGVYSCDCGKAYDGRIYRYVIENAKPVFDKDITPFDAEAEGVRKVNGSFGGICAENGILVTSTVCRKNGDRIYRSYDGGENWEIILHDLDTGKINWTVSYMKPEYSGGHSCIHWMSDFKISPHNSNFAIFNTGTGIFATQNLNGKIVEFEPMCNGIEETVHLNVYSTPKGRTKVIDIVGDLGGFAFEDTDKPCENTFADENGNRYITCLNADFTLNAPERVVATPRGNWTGSTKGGVILSNDSCRTWKRLPYPMGISDKIDRAIEEIKLPNVDSGWVSLSADGRRICWAIGRGFSSNMTVYTDDEGKHWQKSEFLDLSGRKISREKCVRIFTDYFDENLAFAVSSDFRVFISRDKSASFREFETGLRLSPVRFNRFQVTRQPDKSGVFWLAEGSGLYRFEITADSVIAMNVLSENDFAHTIGFGKGKDKLPATYCTGVIGGEYGFYRSDDLCKSWVKINDTKHNFGDIIAICGDMREYGRFYLATGTLGLITGAKKDTLR